MKKTYKQQLIDKITKEILKQDDLLANSNYHMSVVLGDYSKLINLRSIRKRIQALHGKHFVLNRFKSSEFISIKLSLESLSIYI